ncbi:hypothetical protein EDB83DRAFT_2410398 [Lactarius deliciosus]|nr:hypothetical protein EDB83DRAFT_2410398 [Lactarius deliciosus]
MRQIRVPDVVRAARLLQHSMDANRIRSDQCRPLRVASYCRKLGVVQLLLERTNAPYPLHWGEYESQEDGTHLGWLLLERDLDVSARGEEKWTPFHAASYYGKLEIVQLFCDRVRVVNTNARKMVSALHDYYWSAAQT